MTLSPPIIAARPKPKPVKPPRKAPAPGAKAAKDIQTIQTIAKAAVVAIEKRIAEVKAPAIRRAKRAQAAKVGK